MDNRATRRRRAAMERQISRLADRTEIVERDGALFAAGPDGSNWRSLDDGKTWQQVLH